MTTQLKARPAEPRVHVQADQWMTAAELAEFWHALQQRLNDARHAMQDGSVFDPIGIDSEGGGHD
ncbi:hypothetical protein [Pseudomonas abyssi]|uniref:hypothetical protein n=1 Tax=Pseudomonas abyssi TaxID=170540 RepID=UPI003C7A8F3F